MATAASRVSRGAEASGQTAAGAEAWTCSRGITAVGGGESGSGAAGERACGVAGRAAGGAAGGVAACGTILSTTAPTTVLTQAQCRSTDLSVSQVPTSTKTTTRPERAMRDVFGQARVSFATFATLLREIWVDNRHKCAKFKFRCRRNLGAMQTKLWPGPSDVAGFMAHQPRYGCIDLCMSMHMNMHITYMRAWTQCMGGVASRPPSDCCDEFAFGP